MTLSRCFFIVLCLQFIVTVLSEAPLAPPQDIHVDGWLMTWTPPPQETTTVTYTVQYSSTESNVWVDVPSCVQIPDRKCDVVSTRGEDEHDCVMLRVRAERRGLRSVPAEACSRHGDRCTPDVSLTARPGYLTVHLSSNHSLAQEYADHAKHRVYYGREGEPLRMFKEDVSSVTIDGLEVGQRYCVKVQYVRYSQPVGLPSCPRCELIPDSAGFPGHTWIIPTVVVLVLLATLSVGITCVLAFHCGRIKRWLRETRYHIPEDYFLESFPDSRCPVAVSGPCEEHYDVISFIALREPTETREQLLEAPPVGDAAASGPLPWPESEPQPPSPGGEQTEPCDRLTLITRQRSSEST
ncbi:uncharacterized protein [Antennarius striatus]|uniref:uncharacterized protein n=1 Tax=Antennarius striatus TaxID=241820 RepID=UPI0035B32CF7